MVGTVFRLVNISVRRVTCWIGRTTKQDWQDSQMAVSKMRPHKIMQVNLFLSEFPELKLVIAFPFAINRSGSRRFHFKTRISASIDVTRE